MNSGGQNITPPSAMALLLAGLDHHRADRLSEAEKNYRAALAVNPAQLDGWVLMAHLALHLSRPEDAAKLLRQAAATGGVDAAARQFASAASQFPHADVAQAAETIMACLPIDGVAALTLGSIFGSQRLFAGAEKFFRHAAALMPGQADAFIGLSAALVDQGKWREALDIIDQGLKLSPGQAVLFENQGLALRFLGRLPDAITAFRRAAAAAPGHAGAYANLAEALQEAGDAQGALDAIERAITLAPNDSRLIFNRAHIRMSLGDMAGLEDYEARFAAHHLAPDGPCRGMKRWDGGVPRGKLLIWREQGVGDELMWASLIGVTRQRLPKTTEIAATCDPRLVAMFSRSFPGVGFAADVEKFSPDPDRDEQIPVGSLPLVLKIWEGNGWPIRKPYLLPPPAVNPTPAGRKAGAPLRIAISWRGGLPTGERASNYPAITELRPLADIPNICWVNVQYGAMDWERAAFADMGMALEDIPDLDLRNDFDGVAQLMAGLDAYVGVVNASQWLAGAIGLPVFALIRGADYGALGQDPHPYVPVHQGFHSRAEGWADAINALCAALTRFVVKAA